MRSQPRAVLALLLVVLSAPCTLADQPQQNAEPKKKADPKKIVLIAGIKSHGPGVHEYEKSVKLLKVMLDRSPNAGDLQTEVHFGGWPQDPSTLDDADTIMTISDGQDGDKYSPVPWMTPERMRVMQKQMKRGCGFITLHFSTFTPDKYGPQVLEWGGGYFDWQDETGRRNWYSRIRTVDSKVRFGDRQHPVLRGLEPFRLRDEYYYRIRFRPGDRRLAPLVYVPELSEIPEEQIVAWAVERADGGRGFCTTTGHFFDNWKNPSYRRMILNALVWTAGAEVPAGGVESEFYSDEQVERALAGEPIRAVIVSGNNHPAHRWPETNAALLDILSADLRMQPKVVGDPEFLAHHSLHEFDLVVLNYCNWKRPGLSDAAKENFLEFLRSGGGLVIVHFANGAFHYSLPEAEESDWPEYRKICRRVWDHSGRSGHDRFGQFQVDVVKPDHPVTAGMESFTTTDELYFRQQGKAPIEVLATARSKVTGEDEPMAFVYPYEQARVFQTVLGHAAESLRNPPVANLLRRAAAWVAHREPVTIKSPLPQKENSTAPQQSRAAGGQPVFVEGRFGKALDARSGSLTIAHRDAYQQPPMTVECWARVKSKSNFNILVAKNSKTSTNHWELFTFRGSGHFTVYMPGLVPDHVRSGVDVTDDRWHHLAMTFDGRRVRLLVDGKMVADEAVKRKAEKGRDGPLWIGAYDPPAIGCDGLIDEVRISRVVRRFDGPPREPLEADEQTVGLWRLDEFDGDRRSPDESAGRNHSLELSAAPLPRSQQKNHFGQAAVGFQWTESDSRDGRFNRMDTGRFFCGSIATPHAPVAKGLCVRVGENRQAAVCYDTENLALRAGFSGEFLKFDPTRFGLIGMPKIAGQVRFSNEVQSGWQGGKPKYRGLYLHGPRVVLEYRVGKTMIRESPWWESSGKLQFFTRTFEIGHGDRPLSQRIVTADEIAKARHVRGRDLVAVEHGNQVTAVAIQGDERFAIQADGNHVRMTVSEGNPGHRSRARLLVFSGTPAQLERFATWVRTHREFPLLQPMTQPGPRRWPEQIVTRGELGQGPGPYVVDTLPLPLENPYGALMFLSGHDFFSDGGAAVCTVHGDVWLVSGIDEQLERLTWRRFATGLYQPLGLKIVDDVIHVLGRDQITRLHDRDGNGEADFYECFNNQGRTSTGGHDYAACLETDSKGNFYYVRAGSGLLRVSADGGAHEVVATGFRNPNGMSVGPGDVITVAPQEGNWTPASNICQVIAGGYYGFGGPRKTGERPRGYDPPLCWIPRRRDNSTGGQSWVTSDRWGPLTGELLSFSFGRCRMFLVLRDRVGSQHQGATWEFPLQFDSGVMRGRFHPHDGQLYVSGLKGWVSSAVQDGCLHRVRYVGGPARMPIGWQAHANGLVLQFATPLNRAAAQDVGNYAVSQWNYLWTGNYGSPEYRVDRPGEEGRTEVPIRSATLLPDGKSVFLEIDPLRPVMQMEIRYALRSHVGVEFDDVLHATIHAVRESRLTPGAHARRPMAGRLPEESRRHLRPGLIMRLRQANAHRRTDARQARLAALWVDSGAAASTFLQPGPFHAQFDGYVRVPLRGKYRLGCVGRGTAKLTVNDQLLAQGPLQPSPDAAPLTECRLHTGYNRIRIQYTSGEPGPWQLRLLWQHEQFDREPVPPSALFHDSQDAELRQATRLRQGRQLFVTRNCGDCHAMDNDSIEVDLAAPTAPRLTGSAARFRAGWLYRWLLDPASLRNHITMPTLLDPALPADRRKAAEVTAWLTAAADETEREPQTRDKEKVQRGEIVFENLGCIACHHFEPPGKKDTFGRTSLRTAHAKYRWGALIAFLKQPERHAPSTRMPNFQLRDGEAEALAAYIRERAFADMENALVLETADAARGANLYVSLGCINCHGRPSDKKIVENAARLTKANSADAGCLASGKQKGVPDFRLNTTEREALVQFLSAGHGTSLPRVPVEESAALVARLRCAACHGRDAEGGRWPVILLEEGTQGRLPEPLPNLTHSGEKLHADWTEHLLQGRLDYKPRPWLTARMPAFPGFARSLAVGMAAEHGLPPQRPAPPVVDPNLAAIGEQLTQRVGGLDCRQCHAPAAQILEMKNRAQGVSLAYMAERLRPDFYRRWMRDPLRIDPGTKMPRFVSEGKTKATGLLDGDAHRQIDALWHYLHAVGGDRRGGDSSGP